MIASHEAPDSRLIERNSNRDNVMLDQSTPPVVPSRHTLRLRAAEPVTLFSFSDRPVQQALGLWREQRL